MRRAWEHIHGDGSLGVIAQSGKPADIPRQGARVAGDIDNPLWRHVRYSLDYLGGKALPGRVQTTCGRIP